VIKAHLVEMTVEREDVNCRQLCLRGDNLTAAIRNEDILIAGEIVSAGFQLHSERSYKEHEIKVRLPNIVIFDYNMDRSVTRAFLTANGITAIGHTGVETLVVAA
jgi:hypothetical protein